MSRSRWVLLRYDCASRSVPWTVLLTYLRFPDFGSRPINHDPYGYQLGAMLCFLIFLDNLLKQIEGARDTVWFGFSSGRWELIAGFGVLSVLCQLLYWSDVVRVRDRDTRGD